MMDLLMVDDLVVKMVVNLVEMMVRYLVVK